MRTVFFFYTGLKVSVLSYLHQLQLNNQKHETWDSTLVSETMNEPQTFWEMDWLSQWGAAVGERHTFTWSACPAPPLMYHDICLRRWKKKKSLSCPATNLKSSLRPWYIASDTKSEPKISVWTGLNLSWIYHFLFITTLYPQSLPNTSETDNRGPCCVTLAQFKLESLFKSPLQGTVVTGLSCSEPCSVW